MSTHAHTTPQRVAAINGLAARVLLTAAATAAALVLLRAIAVSALDIPQPAFEPLNVGPLLFSGAGAAVAAGVVLAVLRRSAGRPVAVFRRVAAVVLILSMVGPLSLLAGDPRFPATDGASVAVLAFMHVIAAIIIVAVLTIGERRTE